WPAATGGQPEPARLSAAAVTIAVGVLTKNVILSIVAGATVLFAMLYVLG
ncbi:MAG: AzlD domain-containing protein, partial [Paracoccus sp. (in: a-proteobacteria)]